MKAHDSQDFKAAMQKEISDLEKEGVFEIIPIEDKPKDRKLIRFMWSFKRKQSPIEILLK